MGPPVTSKKQVLNWLKINRPQGKFTYRYFALLSASYQAWKKYKFRGILFSKNKEILKKFLRILEILKF